MRLTLVLAVLLAGGLAAQTQASKTGPVWPCTPGRAIDPTYVKVAEETGGQVFLFDRSEAARSLVLTRESMTHKETVFRASGTLAAGYRDMQFPVDSTIESLLFSVSLQCGQSVTLYRPSGAELDASAPGVEDNRFRSGRIVVMARPEPGTWQVRIVGMGMYFAVVQANSDVALHGVRFVEAGGRPGHEGYFPMTTPLRLSVQQMLSASVSGGGVTGFRMIDSAAGTLQALELAADAATGNDRDFYGPVTPGHPAFRIMVEGRDAKGYAYQRVDPKLFHAVP